MIQLKLFKISTSPLQYGTVLKTACILLLLLGSASYNLKAQNAPNVPENHETSGQLPDPIIIEPGEEVLPVWTFLNNTDCQVGVRIFMSAAGYSMPHYGTVTIPQKAPDGTPGIAYLLSGDVGLAFATSNTITLTHLSFQFFIPGGGGGIQEIYPLEVTPTQWNVSDPPPCDCLKFTVDYANRTITINPC